MPEERRYPFGALTARDSLKRRVQQRPVGRWQRVHGNFRSTVAAGISVEHDSATELAIEARSVFLAEISASRPAYLYSIKALRRRSVRPHQKRMAPTASAKRP